MEYQMNLEDIFYDSIDLTYDKSVQIDNILKYFTKSSHSYYNDILWFYDTTDLDIEESNRKRKHKEDKVEIVSNLELHVKPKNKKSKHKYTSNSGENTNTLPNIYTLQKVLYNVHNEIIFKKKVMQLFAMLVYRNTNPDHINTINWKTSYILFEQIPQISININCNEITPNNIFDSFYNITEIITANKNKYISNMPCLQLNRYTSYTKYHQKKLLFHFGFPFYVFIYIDNYGIFKYYRKDFNSFYKLTPYDNESFIEEMNKIMFNSSINNYDALDIITVNNIIKCIIDNKKINCIDFLLHLSNFIYTYRNYYSTIKHNNEKINFEKFYEIYLIIHQNLLHIPLKN
jgi:hypothetical protein